MTDTQDKKAALRREISKKIAAIPAAKRAEMDQQVVELTLDLLSRYFMPGSTVMAYMPLKDEPDITEILAHCVEADVNLALPRVAASGELSIHLVRDFSDDIVKGLYGVSEPREMLPPVRRENIDLVIVPGRAFSARGDRMGRGKGYYDRLLPTLDATRAALAYDCQVVDFMPVESHDETVDIILTPSRMIDSEAQRRLAANQARREALT
jgi:5-formyltetrahydrofolate cyclo-ligase